MCMTLFGKLQYLSSSVQSPLESETWGLESCQAPHSVSGQSLALSRPGAARGAAVGLRAGRAWRSEIPLPLRDRLPEKAIVRSVYQILPLTQRGRGRRASEEGGPPGSPGHWPPRTPVPLSSCCLFQIKLPKCLPSAALLARHHPALQQVPRASQNPFPGANTQGGESGCPSWPESSSGRPGREASSRCPGSQPLLGRKASHSPGR